MLEDIGAAPVLPDGFVAGNCSALLQGAAEARGAKWVQKLFASKIKGAYWYIGRRDAALRT